MRIKISFVVLVLLLAGCGYNPTGSLPPVTRFESFEDLIRSLKTPAHVATWLNEFAMYGDPYEGWDRPHNWDLAKELAYGLWESYIKGKCIGKCASFASLFNLAARTHGYSSGQIWTYNGSGGHALGWVHEKDGHFWISDNLEYTKTPYKTYEELKQKYITHNESTYFFDDHLNLLNSYKKGSQISNKMFKYKKF